MSELSNAPADWEMIERVAENHRGAYGAACRLALRLRAEVERLIADREKTHYYWRELVATHRCKVCRAKWIDCGFVFGREHDGWSLASPRCGLCCDNVAMGEQIEAIGAFAEVARLNDLVTGVPQLERTIARLRRERDEAREKHEKVYAAWQLNQQEIAEYEAEVERLRAALRTCAARARDSLTMRLDDKQAIEDAVDRAAIAPADEPATRPRTRGAPPFSPAVLVDARQDRIHKDPAEDPADEGCGTCGWVATPEEPCHPDGCPDCGEESET